MLLPSMRGACKGLAYRFAECLDGKDLVVVINRFVLAGCKALTE